MRSKYTVEVLSAQQFLCGEGPVWDKAGELLYWADSLGKDIYCHDPKMNITGSYYHELTAASLALHRNGGLVVSGKNGFSLLSTDKKLHVFENVADGIPINNLNDIIADPQGRVFSGQEAFAENTEYETGFLFRLDNNGEAGIVADGLHLSNGMGFSPDSTMFYLVDTIPAKIYQFDYHPGTGDITNKKVLIQFDKKHGLPDGMTVDKDGFLWVAMFFGGKIIRLDPDGFIEREIALPCTQPTSVTFGGKNFNELFITTAGLEWITNLAPEGHRYELPKGGSVYRVETDFQGREEFQADLRPLF